MGRLYRLSVPYQKRKNDNINMRVLIVEDDEKIASFVAKGLEEAGFAVDHVVSGEDGFNLALTVQYDAAVIDIMLPGLDGLSLIKKLRSKGINTPVIILSAKRSVEDRIRGLQQGSDDYLIKPFSFSELLARIHALLRRAGNQKGPVRLEYEGLNMDLLKREVRRDVRRIDLQPREFSLLEYLMRNAGRVVTRTMIMEHVWNYDFDPQTNVVDVLVCRLRDRIDKGFDKKLLHTIRGVGYVLKKPYKDG
ncbi:transcriptional activator protein CopR [bacterium BMS3Bbin05]|nr:transcriptional activator protein CopR [bacterium BMS3Bbin05]